MNNTILAPINQCHFTGNEKHKQFWPRPDGIVIRLYRDNFGQYRIVLSVMGENVSAVLVGADTVIRDKYTSPAHRGHNYTRQLQALLTLAGVVWRRSEHLTPAGKACYKGIK